MHKWLVPAVVALSIGTASDALAQSRSLNGPRELPPASFKGQQFVDSRGCVFMRAGVGGQVNWVARISRDRKQLCGQLPTFGANQVKVDDGPLPPKGIAEPRTRTASASQDPAPTVLSAKPAPAAPPVVTATPPKVVAVQPAPVQPAPVKTVRVQPAPVPPETAKPVTVKPVAVKPVAVKPAAAPKVVAAKPKVVVPDPEVRAAELPPVAIPPGYRRVDPGGRMNTMSGVGGAQGWQAQDQIWTRETPARLIDAPRRTARVVQDVEPAAAPQVSEPRRSVKPHAAKAATAKHKAAGQGRYVQVGSFAQSGNASRAIGRLQALGLPAAKAPMRSGGRQLQVVLAGPFGSAAEAQQALRAARGAGFADAYLR